MTALTLLEAANQTGRTPRALRLMIEAGELAGSSSSGRWLVDRAELDRLPPPEPAEPPRTGPRLVAAPPPEPELDAADQHPLDALLARLEAQAVEVAQAGERTRSLDDELAATRAQLARARRRIAELEGGERRPAARKPAMRDALHPLFKQTDPPRLPSEPAGPAD